MSSTPLMNKHRRTRTLPDGSVLCIQLTKKMFSLWRESQQGERFEYCRFPEEAVFRIVPSRYFVDNNSMRAWYAVELEISKFKSILYLHYPQESILLDARYKSEIQKMVFSDEDGTQAERVVLKAKRRQLHVDFVENIVNSVHTFISCSIEDLSYEAEKPKRLSL